jgi:hypothetical protein
MTDALAAEGETTQAPDVEARARAQGWRPKEEYRGPPERWTDAETFVKAAETYLPVAVERNRALEQKVTNSEAELKALRGELGEVKQVLTDFRDFASLGEKRAYERARKELEAQRNVAVDHADRQTFERVEAEIAELDKSVQRTKPAETATTKPGATQAEARTVPGTPDPVITSWIAENTWYNADKELQAFANTHDSFLMQTKPGLTVAERLAAVKAKTRAEYPDKFEASPREAAPAVSGGRSPPSRQNSNKRSYDNLPPEAKKACDKFVKTIPNYTREEYVKSYAWED